MKQSNIIYSLIVVIISFASCAKDGETGPQGPNATTNSFTITSWESVPNILTRTAADGLNISSNDVVLSYFNSGNDWIPFPFQSSVGGGLFVFYRPYFHQDYFNLNVINSDGTTPSQSSLLSTPREIKLVVIPARIANPNVNVNNYEEVKAAYNLKD